MTLPAGKSRTQSRSGFTLVELVVALGLFALISVAGFAMLSGIIGTRDRLEGRLARVAELQRAMYLISIDFESMTPGPLEADGASVAFSRAADPAISTDISVRYFLSDGALHRQAGTADQVVVRDVRALKWRFWQNGSWVDLPISGEAGRPVRPGAIEATLTFGPGPAGGSGQLRRVVELPRELQ